MYNYEEAIAKHKAKEKYNKIIGNIIIVFLVIIYILLGLYTGKHSVDSSMTEDEITKFENNDQWGRYGN